MLREELKEGTSVVTSDGRELGKINRFVLDPDTNEVTHIVVEKGWLLSEDKVVPFNNVTSVTDDQVLLSEDVQDFDHLPPFEETSFAQLGDEDFRRAPTGNYPYRGPAAYYWYPRYGYPGFPTYGLATYGWPRAETVRNIPEGTVPLEEGTNVMSSDGKHIGDIERLFLESGSNKATHFLLSQGLFFKDHKLVPANWIKSAKDDGVQLSVSADLLERLPSYEPE